MVPVPHLAIATVGLQALRPPPPVANPTIMAAHNSAACSLCVLLLLLSTATLSASGSPLCTKPSPTPENLPADGEDALPLLRSLELNTGYFFGGKDIEFKDESNVTSSYSYVTRSFSLLPLHADRTSKTAVFHVVAMLTLSGGRDRESHYMGAHRWRRHQSYVGSHSVTFSFDGYYSTGTTSGELCMTGSGSYPEENGSTKRLRDVALHLRVPNPSSITDPFITGSLKGAGFDAISLVAYAEGDTYRYGKRASCSPLPPSSAAAARGALQAIGANFSCAHLKDHLAASYKLQEQDGGGGHAPVSPPDRRLHISEVQCAADGSVRAYASFSNDTEMGRHLPPRPPFMVKDEAVVAEGHWDSARSMLCLRACRVVVGSGESMAVDEECDMGMGFWFPGVWTIRDRSAVAGMLWNSSKAGDGSGVSGVVSASSVDGSIHRGNFSEVKYEYNYTMVEEAKKHCLQDPASSKPKKKVKGSFVAPNNYTDHDLEFHFYDTKGSMVGGGRAYPVAIGSAMVYGDQLAADDSFSRKAVVDMNTEELLNVSYDIRESVPPAGWVTPKNGSYSVILEERRMAAEGVFDPKTGILSMIACREYNSSTTDCQILITVYLASLMDRKAQGHGRGAISSLRNKTAADPLFFEKVDIMLYGMYSEQISESISRMDFESILLVVSTTLPCVFTVMQIFHAKRRSEAAAATSVTMLVVLALGYVAPLVVSSEALFLSRRRQYAPLLPFRSYVPYELSQAMLRAPTLIALLLQLRLIQLALSARKADAEQSKAESSASRAERRALWLCAPLYLIGGALTIVVHVVNALRAAREDSLTVRIGPEPATLWEDLVSSAGLAQDAFLLPQVVMNALSPGGVRAALTPWFYIGSTVVRAMPHVYDVIRAQGYVPSSRPSIVFASPRYDRYGVAWDVIVPCTAIVLAALVFLQQLVGSAAPLFRSRRRLGEYEMVSPL